MSVFYVDVEKFQKGLERIGKVIDKTETERIINEYLHGEGGVIVRDHIREILPVSGRTWNGKKTAASKTNPFYLEKGNLYVKVKTKGDYKYLYFPDDGTNTDHHAGNKQFMWHGADNASRFVENGIIKQLLRRWEET